MNESKKKREIREKFIFIKITTALKLAALKINKRNFNN